MKWKNKILKEYDEYLNKYLFDFGMEKGFVSMILKVDCKRRYI